MGHLLHRIRDVVIAYCQQSMARKTATTAEMTVMEGQDTNTHKKLTKASDSRPFLCQLIVQIWWNCIFKGIAFQTQVYKHIRFQQSPLIYDSDMALWPVKVRLQLVVAVPHTTLCISVSDYVLCDSNAVVSSSTRNFLMPPDTTSFLSQCILSALLSNTLGLHSSLMWKDKIHTRELALKFSLLVIKPIIICMSFTGNTKK
jgi:hypothetical protein